MAYYSSYSPLYFYPNNFFYPMQNISQLPNWQSSLQPLQTHYLPQQNLLKTLQPPPQQTQVKQAEEGIHIELQVLYPKFHIDQKDLIRLSLTGMKKLWNQQQDQLLSLLASEKSQNWKEISLHFPNRNAQDCLFRYKRIQIEWRRRRWSKEEDQILIQCVQKHGKSWKQFVPYFSDRSSKQIRERYVNYLRPKLNKSQWKIQEDFKLCQLLAHYGKKWKIFETYLKGRSENIIKNRFYGHIKKIYQMKDNQDKKYQRKMKYAMQKLKKIKSEEY